MSDKIPKPTASTQEHLDVEDIVDDLIVLKTGWIALVMNTTAVNFDLLSEAEQDATIYAYGAFLNSLTFPIELLIRSKKADISAYFHALAEAEKMQPNPDLKRQIQKYEDFIQATVQQRTVLDKKFYIVITYSPAGTNVGLIGKKTGSAKVKGAVLEAAKASLFPRRDHVSKQLARLGLSSKQLTSQELVELLYDIYNPAPTGTQRIILDSTAYTAPLVEPAIENPAPAMTENKIGGLGGSSGTEASADASALENRSEDKQNTGETLKQEAGLMPQTQISVGQQEAVADAGLRPAPPRSDMGQIGISENQNVGESDISASQIVGEDKDQVQRIAPSPQPAEQTLAQSEAMQALQKAVAEAEKLTGGINKTPSGGLDLRETDDNQDAGSGDISKSGGFKI